MLGLLLQLLNKTRFKVVLLSSVGGSWCHSRLQLTIKALWLQLLLMLLVVHVHMRLLHLCLWYYRYWNSVLQLLWLRSWLWLRFANFPRAWSLSLLLLLDSPPPDRPLTYSKLLRQRRVGLLGAVLVRLRRRNQRLGLLLRKLPRSSGLVSVRKVLVFEAEGFLSVVAVLLCGADDVLELALGNAGLLFDVLEGVAAVAEGHRLGASRN